MMSNVIQFPNKKHVSNPFIEDEVKVVDFVNRNGFIDENVEACPLKRKETYTVSGRDVMIEIGKRTNGPYIERVVAVFDGNQKTNYVSRDHGVAFAINGLDFQHICTLYAENWIDDEGA